MFPRTTLWLELPAVVVVAELTVAETDEGADIAALVVGEEAEVAAPAFEEEAEEAKAVVFAEDT